MNISSKKTVIILAGGIGKRAGGDMPKQFRHIGGKPVIWWSMKAFMTEDPQVRFIVSVHKDFLDELQKLWSALPSADRFDFTAVTGGATRWHSVYNALLCIDDNDSLVAVHDAARPLVDHSLIRRGWQCAEKYRTAIPVIPLSDSIRKVEGGGMTKSVDRKNYVAVQTPQIFDASLLIDAYATAKEEADSAGEKMRFTDDASVVEAFDHNIATYQGDSANIKITNPEDFSLATAILANRQHHNG